MTTDGSPTELASGDCGASREAIEAVEEILTVVKDGYKQKVSAFKRPSGWQRAKHETAARNGCWGPASSDVQKPGGQTTGDAEKARRRELRSTIWTRLPGSKKDRKENGNGGARGGFGTATADQTQSKGECERPDARGY